MSSTPEQIRPPGLAPHSHLQLNLPVTCSDAMARILYNGILGLRIPGNLARRGIQRCSPEAPGLDSETRLALVDRNEAEAYSTKRQQTLKAFQSAYELA